MLNEITKTTMCTLLRFNGQPIAALNQADWAYNQFFVPFFVQNQVPVEQHDAVVNAMIVAAGDAGFDVASQVPTFYQAAQQMAQQQQVPPQGMPQATPPAGGPAAQPAPQAPVNGPTAGNEIAGQQHLNVPNMPPNPISDSQEAPVSSPPTEPASSPTGQPAAHVLNPDGTTVCGECGQEGKSIKGLKSHLTRTHEIKWKDYCAKHNLDKDGNSLGTTAPATTAPDPTAQIPSSQPPTGPDLSAGPAAAQGGMPTPPAPAAVTTVTPPQGAAPQTTPPQATPQAAPPPPQAAAPMVAQQPAGYQPPVNNQPTVVSGRVDIANLLGGAVDLMVVPLLEASTATDQLKGRTDANQLAQLALAQAMTEITDPDDIKFKRHRDVSLRIFGELLTKHPNVFIFQQGYNYLLSDEYLPIITSRAIRVIIVADKGNNIQTVDLE